MTSTSRKSYFFRIISRVERTIILLSYKIIYSWRDLCGLLVKARDFFFFCLSERGTCWDTARWSITFTSAGPWYETQCTYSHILFVWERTEDSWLLRPNWTSQFTCLWGSKMNRLPSSVRLTFANAFFINGLFINSLWEIK